MLWSVTKEDPSPELKLAISLDVESGGWLLEMSTPSLLSDTGQVYSRTLIPMHAIEQGTTDPYIDALLGMHLKLLGLADWPI